jgi:hypothetical protein
MWRIGRAPNNASRWQMEFNSGFKGLKFHDMKILGDVVYKFDIYGSVHRRWLSRNTNKVQLCDRIYYSKVYWRLNMFQAAHRSSSGALNCICSFWFIYPCGDRPLPRLSGKNIFPLSFGDGRSPHEYINQRLQIQCRAPDDERCAARNMLSFQ